MSERLKGMDAFSIIDSTKKVCIMGFGNYDRADDYSGVAVVEALEKKKLSENITVINAGPVPESFTGVIKRLKPDILIIIDATEMNEKPGTIKIFSEEDIESVSIVTPHRTPIPLFLKYLRHFLEDLKTIFIGIQPASIRYAEPMTEAVRKSVTFLSQFLEEQLSKAVSSAEATS